MILTFEFPDFLSDEAAGKRTVLVRLGRNTSATLHNLLILLALALAGFSPFIGLPIQVALSLALTSPLALWQIITVRRMQQGEPVVWSRFTFGAVALFGLTAYFVAFNFWVIGGWQIADGK
jgi:1,4-dihydroxy-2-naphthoate octaprenyltransferase